jgi:hypothetical protein
MSNTVDSIAPPDDTGSDTFSRYVYQAHVAFAYCVGCFLGSVQAVVLEHFEDLAVQHEDASWEFIQIKTRDTDQGPWTLAQLLGKSGPLRSLYRTYKAVSKLEGEFRFSALVEGGIRHGDPAKSLLPGSHGPSEEAVQKVARAFKIDVSEARAFLGRLSVQDNLPQRGVIAAANLRRLGLTAPSATVSSVEAAYDSVVRLLQDAMQAPRLKTRWPKALLKPSNYAQAIRDRFEAKRIDRADIEPLLASLHFDAPILLQSMADPASRTTALEDKLRAAGLSETTITHAKNLRAAASKREAELSASTLEPSPRLEDVRQRLKVLADAVVDEVKAEKAHAAQIWSRIQARIVSQTTALDQTSLFLQDAFVLLGELCELSDLCEFSWGVRDA